MTTLIVQPALVLGEREGEPATPPSPAPHGTGEPQPTEIRDGGPQPYAPPHAKRFYGVIVLDPECLNRDFGRVAQEVVQHLTSLVGTDVEVTVEVRAEASGGFPEQVVRTISENAATLKFTSHAFENE